MAAVQIASNGTRVAAFLKNVDWDAFLRFLIGVIPGGTLGILLLWQLGEPTTSEPYLKTLVGLYILVATYWKPKKAKKSSDSNTPVHDGQKSEGQKSDAPNPDGPKPNSPSPHDRDPGGIFP